MSKDNISQYSTTAASNTDVGGVNINEDCLPSNLNNAIRELMSHLADLNAGNTSLSTIKVDNLQLDLNTISSTDTNGNINITPNGTGSVVIDGLSFPQADGTADQVLKTNGSGQISFGDAASPFAYNAVSGATPSLNVGTYNFFNQGTTTANTTLSFTNVPTEAQWTYTAKLGSGDAYDLSALTATETATPTISLGATYGIHVKDDGTRLYLFTYPGNVSANGNVHEFTMSTAYDLSTLSQVTTFNYSASITNQYTWAFYMDSTGSYFYTSGFAGTAVNRIYRFALSTPYDLSTASYSAGNFSDAATAQINNVAGEYVQAFTLNSDGTKIYVADQRNIYQYSLSTAYDISTASYDSKTYDVETNVTTTNPNIRGIEFNNDGTKIFVNAFADSKVYELDLSTAYDISTASYNSVNGSISATVNSVGLAIANSGGLFYTTSSTPVIQEYSAQAGHTLTLPSSVNSTPKESFSIGDTVTYEFWTADGGTNVYISNEEVM